MPPKDKYTDPKLREEVKEDIQAGDKGGAPGQWSARKAQMMAKEYKKRGGDYNTDKSEKDESQKNLTKWGDEDWQTKEGSGDAKQPDGSEKRYLPKKAWEKMTEEEKQETEDKKQAASKEGQQFVGNTDKAKQSRKDAEKDAKEPKQGTRKSPRTQTKQPEKKPEEADDQKANGKKATPAKRGNNDSASPNKKQKTSDQDDKPDTQKGAGKGKHPDTYGSKKQSTDAPAPQASVDRLPSKGQKVHWKAMPGWVEGEVIEVLKADKEVEGKKVKASDKDPRVVLRSHGPSGKVAVHKVDAVYFE